MSVGGKGKIPTHILCVFSHTSAGKCDTAGETDFCRHLFGHNKPEVLPSNRMEPCSPDTVRPCLPHARFGCRASSIVKDSVGTGGTALFDTGVCNKIGSSQAPASASESAAHRGLR